MNAGKVSIQRKFAGCIATAPMCVPGKCWWLWCVADDAALDPAVPIWAVQRRGHHSQPSKAEFTKCFTDPAMFLALGPFLSLDRGLMIYEHEFPSLPPRPSRPSTLVRDGKIAPDTVCAEASGRSPFSTMAAAVETAQRGHRGRSDAGFCRPPSPATVVAARSKAGANRSWPATPTHQRLRPDGQAQHMDVLRRSPQGGLMATNRMRGIARASTTRSKQLSGRFGALT